MTSAIDAIPFAPVITKEAPDGVEHRADTDKAPEFKQAVVEPANVGVATLLFTVTVRIVGIGLWQPDSFTQLNEYENVPAVAAEIEKETNVAEVAVVLIPTLTPAPMLLDTTTPPDVRLPPGVTRQFELTISGELPWQMATAPVPPPTTATLAGVPLTAVIEARFGRATIVVETTEVELVQVGVTHESV